MRSHSAEYYHSDTAIHEKPQYSGCFEDGADSALSNIVFVDEWGIPDDMFLIESAEERRNRVRKRDLALPFGQSETHPRRPP
jgi:hypothetical protein